MKKLILILSLFIYILSGCQKEEMKVIPPFSDFTYTISNSYTVSFLNKTENAISYSWDFGDGTMSTEINPTKGYAAGTYKVILTVFGKGGSTTNTKLITIADPRPICEINNYGFLKVVNSSSNPYYIYIDGNYQSTVSGYGSLYLNIYGGYRHLYAKQVSGYVLYPTTVDTYSTIIHCINYNWNIP